jgi:opacity protein-like surface antigen
MRSWRVTAVSVLLLLGTSVPAYADATLFLGSTLTPTRRVTRGFAVGASLILFGFEFEYANTAEDPPALAPTLQTGMGNLYAQTPFGAIQFYGLLGAGLYRERVGTEQETSTASAVGGGAKLSLAGPLRVRLDYRFFNLRGTPRYSRVHRLYAGLNLTF